MTDMQTDIQTHRQTHRQTVTKQEEKEKRYDTDTLSLVIKKEKGKMIHSAWPSGNKKCLKVES